VRGVLARNHNARATESHIRAELRTRGAVGRITFRGKPASQPIQLQCLRRERSKEMFNRFPERFVVALEFEFAPVVADKERHRRLFAARENGGRRFGDDVSIDARGRPAFAAATIGWRSLQDLRDAQPAKVMHGPARRCVELRGEHFAGMVGLSGSGGGPALDADCPAFLDHALEQAASKR